MAKKKINHLPKEEKHLRFEDVKEMTVGQIEQKQQEIKDGIEEGDSVLDRYIKQHREAIEANKFDTIVQAAVQPDPETDLSQELTKELPVLEEEIPVVTSTVAAPWDKIVPDTDVDMDESDEEDVEKASKKKLLIWSSLVIAFIGILAATLLGLQTMNQSSDMKSTASSEASTSSSSEEKDAQLSAFEQLYATFFTDGSLSKLKNDMFAKLPELKALLDKIDPKSKGYSKAKADYEALEKAIKAIQAINDQFDKPAIVNGELDTTATVKPGATFVSTTTGISPVDTMLTTAINYGRTQKPVSSSTAPASAGSGVQAGASVPAEAPVETPVYEDPVTTAPPAGNGSAIWGIPVPAGVTLQRNLSRVPYDQSKIDDAANEAWVFAPGVLEKIIETSQQRGYISGNQYILEKVNIINGRGYYNLFKPDGTYLFSINCKTGYFVGNGPGYADDLDF